MSNEHPPQGSGAVAISTDLIGSLIETVKGKRGVVRVAAVVVDLTFGPELHFWIEDQTDYGDDKVNADHSGKLVRVDAKGTRVLETGMPGVRLG